MAKSKSIKRRLSRNAAHTTGRVVGHLGAHLQNAAYRTADKAVKSKRRLTDAGRYVAGKVSLARHPMPVFADAYNMELDDMRTTWRHAYNMELDDDPAPYNLRVHNPYNLRVDPRPTMQFDSATVDRHLNGKDPIDYIYREAIVFLEPYLHTNVDEKLGGFPNAATYYHQMMTLLQSKFEQKFPMCSGRNELLNRIRFYFLYSSDHNLYQYSSQQDTFKIITLETREAIKTGQYN
jgi:hypothetical protein